MATALVTAISINDRGIWRGGSRLVYGRSGVTGDTPITPFPTYIEKIISLSTYALTAGFTDFGATTDDGVTIGRTWDTAEGIPIDQRDYNIRAGAAQNVAMTVSGTSLDTSLERLSLLWGVDQPTTLSAGAGTPANVAQRVSKIGGVSNPYRVLVVIQQNDETGDVKVFAFRKAKIVSAGDIGMNKNNPSTQDFQFRIDPDPTITDGSDYGLMFSVPV